MKIRGQNKGFIQRPRLIARSAGVLVWGAAGYIGIKHYQKYQTQKLEKEKIVQEKEKQVQIKTETQQKAIEEAQKEIEELKKQNAESKKANKNIYASEITASEIASYLSGIQEVNCNNLSGSGSLWKLDGLYFVLTNQHVLGTLSPNEFCQINYDSNDNSFVGIYFLYQANSNHLTLIGDKAIMSIKPIKGVSITSADVSSLNYKISSIPFCKNDTPENSPVVIIGYPASTRQKVYNNALNTYIDYDPRTVTNGVISGYDTSQISPLGNLKYSNYFVSAKIDSGNYGGIALSKNSGGQLCILGIPTWLNIGNYDTQGIIQNINNIMYQP